MPAKLAPSMVSVELMPRSSGMVTTAPGICSTGKAGADRKKFGASTVTSTCTDWPATTGCGPTTLTRTLGPAAWASVAAHSRTTPTA
ncbi:hypothetical protein D3C81_949040 [compost metagenome]